MRVARHIHLHERRAVAGGGERRRRFAPPSTPRDNNRVANWSATTTYNGPRQLIVMTNEWRYYRPAPWRSTDWRKAAFDDATWRKAAPALRRDGGVARAKDHCAHAGQTDVLLPHALYDPVGPDGGDTEGSRASSTMAWSSGSTRHSTASARRRGRSDHDTLANRTVNRCGAGKALHRAR